MVSQEVEMKSSGPQSTEQEKARRVCFLCPVWIYAFGNGGKEMMSTCAFHLSIISQRQFAVFGHIPSWMSNRVIGSMSKGTQAGIAIGNPCSAFCQ